MFLNDETHAVVEHSERDLSVALRQKQRSRIWFRVESFTECLDLCGSWQGGVCGRAQEHQGERVRGEITLGDTLQVLPSDRGQPVEVLKLVVRVSEDREEKS